jgi:hypothetical protein
MPKTKESKTHFEHVPLETLKETLLLRKKFRTTKRTETTQSLRLLQDEVSRVLALGSMRLNTRLGYRREESLKGEKRHARLMELCEQASNDQDAEELMKLIAERVLWCQRRERLL